MKQIENHKKAAKHLEEAVKYHNEAIQHHEAEYNDEEYFQFLKHMAKQFLPWKLKTKS